MKKGLLITIIVIVAILLIGGIAIGSTYNSILRKSEDVNQKFSNIDTQLQRRSDLIPNLINTVKGYMTHEQDAIKLVTDARSKLAGASTIEEKAEANSELSSALGRLMVVVENYPDLKASQNFIQLSDELAGTENRVRNARGEYNEAVKEYNLSIQKFPANIIAGMFNFEKKPYFEADEGSSKVPEVNF